MTLDRRQFIGIAGLGTASIIAGCNQNQEQPVPTASMAGTTSSPPAGATLKLLLWGSCLYAFSNQGKRVEVAYLTTDPMMPGCSFLPHRPVLGFPAGGGRLIPEKTTVVLGPNLEFPPGVYRVSASSLGSQATDLKAVGLGENPADCAAPGPKIESLGFVPTLSVAGSSVAASWRDRFGVRIVFDRGELRAHAPFHGEKEIARWIVKGPAAATSQPLPFTDTLELTLPLAGDTVTFESEDGKLLTFGVSGDPMTIEARVMAHAVAPAAAPLKEGEKEPHFCSLYSLFEPIPAAEQRAELFFKDWCPAAAVVPAPTGPLVGPSPGKYCTGGKISL